MSESILEAREKRWMRKCQLAKETALTVIAVTVNAPANCKKDKVFEKAHSVIVRGLMDALCINKLEANLVSMNYGADGPEAYLTVKGEPYEVKRICVMQESLPGGRIADIDVMKADGSIVSRRDIGLEDRRCFLCSDSARHCMLEKRHSIEEIIKAAVVLALEADSNCLSTSTRS